MPPLLKYFLLAGEMKKPIYLTYYNEACVNYTICIVTSIHLTIIKKAI